MSAKKEKTAMEQAAANWQLYYVLTQELLKFINKQDIDEFLDLAEPDVSLSGPFDAR